MLEVCKCMRAYSMHESQSKEIRPYVPERQTVHADYMPAEFLFHQKSPHNRDNKIYIHVGKSTLHMQETLYFLIKLLNRCYATSRHNIFILWCFAASLCITTSLFYHSPTFTKKNSNQGREVIYQGCWQQGVYCARMLLARMLDFRLLPCCKVIAIMSWLTVVDFAFEVRMSFHSILKSPYCHNLLMIHTKIILSADSDWLE